MNKDNSDYVLPGQDYIPQHIPIQDNEDELMH